MIGRVISTKLRNTATVLIERTSKHPLYKKTYIQSKKYLTDDPIGVKDGDIVEIINCKPVSKNKNWKIVKVVGQNFAEIVEAQQKQAAEEIIAEVMPADKLESSKNLELKSDSKHSEKEVVMDDSIVKPKAKRKGRIKSSKKTYGSA